MRRRPGRSSAAFAKYVCGSVGIEAPESGQRYDGVGVAHAEVFAGFVVVADPRRGIDCAVGD
jgi:hypothetical protein